MAKSPTDYIVAIEVKYRASDRYGSPLSAVTYPKQKKIIKTLMLYLKENHISQNSQCRLDVIGVYGSGKLEHIENAFESACY